ncbi:RPAP1-like protein [Podospora didyma]|uniref:RPAP1-like protein n=1 Tax=Podospora didyma TaxID=330526 RepID=A0AAE0TZ71_9PEZI|nr:RPAP1-like protein [Podospora didyma]
MESTLEILDVQERAVGDVKPPSFPTPPSASGFPAHKKRVSVFKQQRQAKESLPRSKNPATVSTQTHPPHSNESPEVAERRRIDEENQARLEALSPEEIAEAQKELFGTLDPRLLQLLLRRANLDEQRQRNEEPSPFDIPPAATTEDTKPPALPVAPPEIRVQGVTRAGTVRTEEEENDQMAQPNDYKTKHKKTISTRKKTVSFDIDSAAPAAPPRDLPNKKEALLNDAPANTTHFPHPPSRGDLDPSDPNFLVQLHEKFFPNLPADPSKLAWMAPIPTPDSVADRESPYYPGQDSLPVSALRFDFRGTLLPPRVSRSIPVTKGLHHHGEAPEAAGYTIPELARLARSAVPSQRCIAFQTLGRILYRLGRGEWGLGEGGRDGNEDDLAFSMWRCFREGVVLESLGEAAAMEGGHMSCKAFATEALWLFEKGGWKENWRGL